MAGSVIDQGTVLSTTPPPAIANSKWWPMVVVLVRNGVGIVAAIGIIPATGSDNVASYILGGIIAVGVVISEGMGLASYFRAEADTKVEEINADKEKVRSDNDKAISDNAVKLESLRVESLRLENMRLNMTAAPVFDPATTLPNGDRRPEFRNPNLIHSGPPAE